MKTFEKNLHSVSRAAAYRRGCKSPGKVSSWSIAPLRYFPVETKIRFFYPIHTLNHWKELSGVLGCLSCWRLQCRFPAEAAPIYTMHEALMGYCPWGWEMRPVNWIYSLWRHCPQLVLSTATKSSPLGYFSRLLQEVSNWPHFLWGLTLLHAELRSTAGLLCPSPFICGTNLMTLCLMVWDSLVLSADPMHFYLFHLHFLFRSTLFPLFLPSMGWLGGVGVFRLIESINILSQHCTADFS